MTKNTEKGKVLDCLPNLQYKVELADGRVVRAYLAGKMKMNKIKVIIGDKVSVEIPETGEIYRLVHRD